MTAIAPPPAQIPTGIPNPPRPTSSASNRTDSRRQSTDPKVVVVEPSAKEEEVKREDAPKSPTAKADNPQRPSARPHVAAKSKFDLEPNPFDLSFQSHRSTSAERQTPPRGTDATVVKHNALPPLAYLTSPAAADASQFPWLASQSLRTGPLSPAMLSGPQQQQNNVHNQNGNNQRPQTGEAAHQEGGAFDSNTFRTGFTPGTGSGFTPGYTSLMGGNFASSLPMPSPNTAAFLNMVTNSTPLGEGSGDGQQQNNSSQGHTVDPLHPPSAIPPHLQQQHHGLSHLHPQSDLPQETITPGTLSALTGVFNDMSRAQQAGPNGALPQYFPPPGMHPPHAPLPGQLQPGNGVDYAQQSANAASQAANGLFLLSQAHQELSKREEHDPRGTPLLVKSQNSSKSLNGSANGGQKRKSDASAPKANPPAKKGKKAPVEKAKAESTSPNFSMSDDDMMDDDEVRMKDGKPETEEEKRKNFLERNRQAALKCRQRKKAWLNELQAKVEQLSVENERLQQTIGGLHDELGRLNAILMQHRDCGLGIGAGYGRPIR